MIEKSFLPIDIEKFGNKSGNLYKSLMVVGKRANQITLDIKEELAGKLSEFAPAYDNLEEVMENKEQIEISRTYERKPKPSQTSLEEFFAEEIYVRDPHEEDV